MPYAKLLSQIINDKGYTNKELAEMCEIDDSYIGKLQNEKLKLVPNEEISKKIAKACGIDERKLIIEGYIDKAPKVISDMLKAMKFMQATATMNFMNLQKIINVNEIEKSIDNEPLSDVIIATLDNKASFSEFINKGFIYEKINDSFNFSVAFKNPVGIEIQEDSMEPIIQKNDKVKFEIKDKYKSNDILLVKYQDKIMARYVYKVNDYFKLVPSNRKYEEVTIKSKDIIILGRVSDIIRKI